MPLPSVAKKHALIAIAVALWLPVVAFGFRLLWTYSSTPGRPAAPPAAWPSGAPIAHAKHRATLLLFAHPKCPCSESTIGELSVIVAHTAGKLESSVYFYVPENAGGDWETSSLWHNASAIPGVRCFVDRDGRMARTFGAFTSGQTLLYDDTGHLLFSGGITAFRGHSGDNFGRDAVIKLSLGQAPRGDLLPVSAPVFGCSLGGGA
jgi:hypothetical protein